MCVSVCETLLYPATLSTILPCFTLTYPSLPYPALPYATLRYATLPYLTVPYPSLPYPTLHYTLPFDARRQVSEVNDQESNHSRRLCTLMPQPNRGCLPRSPPQRPSTQLHGASSGSFPGVCR